MCFLRPRTNYLGADGKPVKGVTKGSVVTYLGENIGSFAANFTRLGSIVIPYSFYSEHMVRADSDVMKVVGNEIVVQPLLIG